MSLDKTTPPVISLEEARKIADRLLEKFPVEMFVMMGLACLAAVSRRGDPPKWLKDMPPINPKTAGPWRGRGSFGTHFGPQVSGHK